MAKRITVQSAKAKGRKFQQEVAQKISELLNIPFGKDECIASREMGQSGTDIRLIGDALKQFPYSIEVKAQESWSVHSWIDQAESNIIPGTNWLLACKRSRKKGTSQRKVIIIDYDHFFELLTLIHSHCPQGLTTQPDSGRMPAND
jgi:hypothetical protein